MVLPVVLLALGTLVSWLMIDRLTSAMSASGFGTHHLTVRELIWESLAPKPALFGSLSAIALGLLLFLERRPIARFLRSRLPALLAFARSGFGFDAVYCYVREKIVRSGGKMVNAYEEHFGDGLDYAFVRFLNSVSGALGRGHTGDLSLEVLGIMAGFLIILALLFGF